MRIGIFGGTFDPVHVGHLILAEQCREQGQLDQVWFLPAARPPHKLDRELTPFALRVEMLQLAIAGNKAFRVEEIERDRPGPSYTADTLDALSAMYPDGEWHLLIGSDTLADLPSWHEPQRILRRAGLVIVDRPNQSAPTVESVRASLATLGVPAIRSQLVKMPLIDVSSRDLRRRVALGLSVRYQVPRAVECYIETKRLYRPKDSLPEKETSNPLGKGSTP